MEVALLSLDTEWPPTQYNGTFYLKLRKFGFGQIHKTKM